MRITLKSKAVMLFTLLMLFVCAQLADGRPGRICAFYLCAPYNLQAVAVSPYQINLTWEDANYNEDAFQIQRRVLPGEFHTVAFTVRNTYRYEDVGLAPATTYFYRIRAIALYDKGTLYSDWVESSEGKRRTHEEDT